MVLLKEADVEKAIRHYLRDKGFKLEQKSNKGVDIRANKLGYTLFVEVEGNARNKRDPLKSRSARYTHFYRCVGQICARMGEGNEKSRYAIGLPDDDKYREYVGKVRKAFELLDVNVLWVHENNTVRVEMTGRAQLGL